MATNLSLSFIPDFPLPASNFRKHSKEFLSSAFRRFVHLPIINFARAFQAVEDDPQPFVQPIRKWFSLQVQSRFATRKLILLHLLNSSSSSAAPAASLVAAALLDRNVKLRLLLRDPEKATTLFGEQDEDLLQVRKGNTRNPEDLDPSVFEGVTHVICCTGTTAFPSKRWDGDNTPERVDWEGVRNLISALPRSVKRVVLVSSIGVTKFNELPWSMMNLFGVLKYKKQGEDFLRDSDIKDSSSTLSLLSHSFMYKYVCPRAGRLTDGPYTSYDLNTLLKATAGQRHAVLLGQGDKLVGEASRIVVAEACIQALDIDFTEGQAYEINSVVGEGPGNDPQKWSELFKAAQTQ